MKQTLIIGVDVSKAFLDCFLKPMNLCFRISNDISGFKKLLKVIRSHCTADTEILVVMEHTGLYSCRFEQFLQQNALSYCKLPALEIKRSIGMTRGKHDQLDAERIAQYAWLRRDILQADQYPQQAITKLRLLLTFRQKLTRDKVGYQCRLKELLNSGVFSKDDPIVKQHKLLIETLQKNIREVELQIRQLIKSEAQLQKTFDLLTSIKGVGPIIGAAMIAYTENFTKFSAARKFNCYAGLAPFKHQSGRSIYKKDQVSQLANKTIKALIGNGASSAIQHNEELKNYYYKRLAEGKPKGSCKNMIKAKLVARMFAVVKRQTPYQPVAA